MCTHPARLACPLLWFDYTRPVNGLRFVVTPGVALICEVPAMVEGEWGLFWEAGRDSFQKPGRMLRQGGALLDLQVH